MAILGSACVRDALDAGRRRERKVGVGRDRLVPLAPEHMVRACANKLQELQVGRLGPVRQVARQEESCATFSAERCSQHKLQKTGRERESRTEEYLCLRAGLG